MLRHRNLQKKPRPRPMVDTRHLAASTLYAEDFGVSLLVRDIWDIFKGYVWDGDLAILTILGYYVK